ncbi:MAG: hypothetical protein QM731_10610 [Chitinophagaceae bacterium]
MKYIYLHVLGNIRKRVRLAIEGDIIRGTIVEFEPHTRNMGGAWSMSEFAMDLTDPSEKELFDDMLQSMDTCTAKEFNLSFQEAKQYLFPQRRKPPKSKAGFIWTKKQLLQKIRIFLNKPGEADEDNYTL